jgi:galactose mutarotase-like enzyme
VLELIENEDTLKMYPFKFRLLVSYSLKGNRLSISNSVENRDAKEMYFSIGAHPGFNIPFTSDEKYDDYYLEFEQNETAARLPLTKKTGFLSNLKIEKYLENTNKLHLNHQLFKDRAVILEGLKSKIITIKSEASKMSITIGIANFPFLGIWTSYKKHAPFICIEPWYGISDYETTSGNFKTKKGIQSLKKGEVFDMDYFIEINN